MFGKILKENRMNAGLTLREFAGKIEISPGYLSDLENEKVAPPSEKLILEMAKILGIEKDDLLRAAEKVDPEVTEYVAQEPRAADFLRMAKEQEFRNGDWEKLRQLAKIAGLGKQEEEKK
jgi:HTH-type transcriptional regulator, competence development regulator